MRNDILASLRALKPLPKNSWNVNCSLCDKPQARWMLQLGLPNPVFVCGMCVLYESEWGQNNVEMVGSMMDQIRRASGREFSLMDGRLLRPSDADDVLGVIVLMEMTMRRMPKERR
jgi:hypothetical protein